MHRFVHSLWLLLLFAGSADAQPPSLYDAGWLVQPGDTLTITDNAGVRVRGKLVEITTTSLVLDVSRALRQFQESEIYMIERRGDSLKNGALIGFSAGGALAAALATSFRGSDWRFDPEDYLAVIAVFGGVGAGIGVGIDALIRGHTVIYARSRSAARTVSFAPILGRGRKGALVSVRLTR